VVTITITCYSWAPSCGDHLFCMWRHLQAATLVKRSVLSVFVNLCCRDVHWSGLGLGWIRTAPNFIEFGLDPDCKSLEKLGPVSDLDWVIRKELRHFCCEKAAFSNVWISFGLGLYIWKHFWTVVGLGLSFKKLDWIWITNNDSPLISAVLCRVCVFILWTSCLVINKWIKLH